VLFARALVWLGALRRERELHGTNAADLGCNLDRRLARWPLSAELSAE
jgi:hypothetical protein